MVMPITAFEAEVLSKKKGALASAGFCLITDRFSQIKAKLQTLGLTSSNAAKSASRAIQMRRLFLKAAERHPQIKAMEKEWPDLESILRQFQSLAALGGAQIQNGVNLRDWLTACALESDLTRIWSQMVIAGESRNRSGQASLVDKQTEELLMALAQAKAEAYAAPTKAQAIELIDQRLRSAIA